MPFAPGTPKPPGSGRKKGSLARLGATKGPISQQAKNVAERLNIVGCDPFDILAKIAMGTLPCGVCFGMGKTRYQAGKDRQFERTCQSCYGSALEHLSPGDRMRAAAELAQYLEPKRKAIEVAGTGGGPIQSRHEFVAVTPGQIPDDLK